MSNLNIRSLFVGLPEKPSRKLIAFSDSRDRAARLASNVAIRHREAAIASSVISRARDLTISEPEYVRRIHAGEELDAASEAFVEKYSSEDFTPKVVFSGDLNQEMEAMANFLQHDFAEETRERIANRGLNSQTENRLRYSLEESLTDYKFDFDKFTNINGKTGIYIQYAFVRAKKLIQDSNIDVANTDVVFSDLDETDHLLLRSFLKFEYYFNPPHISSGRTQASNSSAVR